MKRDRLLRYAAALLVAVTLLVGSISSSTAQKPADPPAGPSSDGPSTDGAKVNVAKRAKPTTNDREYLELLRLFVDTLDQIDRNYVTEIDRRKLVEAAVRGMLSELDPYSNYISPAQIERFRRGVENEFGGVGIQVRIDGDDLQIVSPIYGTPAYEAGLMAGDVILEIAGKTARGITIDDAVKLMKGKIGTTVSLKIKSPDTDETRDVDLNREVIRLRTVLGERRRADDSWDYMLDDDQKIGLIRITSFGRHTVEELRSAIAQLRKRGMRALVLDLRSNPGGLLTAAVEVCDMFISEGRIVSTSGRNSPKRTWDAREAKTVGDFPMAILVNRFSASASEIVSACLQDHERAVVVGQRTWGKGSVQNIIDLEEGSSAIKLTTAAYLRPSGANIHRAEGLGDDDAWGVRPSPGYDVELPIEEARLLQIDRQRRDLILRRRPKPGDSKKLDIKEKGPDTKETGPDAKGDAGGDGTKDGNDQPGDDQPGGDRDLPTDRQLDKALEYLRDKLSEAVE